jgi:hypothetical protein
MELLYGVAATVTLALAFLAIDRSSVERLRKLGPWLLVLVVSVAIVVAIPPTLDSFRWADLKCPTQLRETLEGFGFLLSFGIEAVLISRLLLRIVPKPLAFVPAFVGAAFALWFVTLMIWSAMLPGS